MITAPTLTGYAICTVGRSGSNWIGQIFSSTGELGHPEEYFNPVGRRLAEPDYPLDPARQVERILTDGATGNGIYALKIFPEQLQTVAATLQWTRSLPNLRFIYWKRRDVLGQALSRLRAQQTWQWRSTHVRRGQPAYDGPAALDSLRVVVRQYACWDMFFARNGLHPLRLTYEDAVANPQAAVDAVASVMRSDLRPQIDPAQIDLHIQRDALTDAWRQRFHTEFGDLDRIEDV